MGHNVSQEYHLVIFGVNDLICHMYKDIVYNIHHIIYPMCNRANKQTTHGIAMNHQDPSS